MHLFLVRHGQTIQNSQNICQGQGIGGDLTDLGIKQAKRAGKDLIGSGITVIYASSLKRAKDTAAIIHSYVPDAELILTEGLWEADLGPYEGTPKQSIDWRNRPVDIESEQSMQDRAKTVLMEAYKKHPDQNVLFVAHAGINLALRTFLESKPAEEMRNMNSPKNATIFCFEITMDRKKIVSINEKTQTPLIS